MTAVLLTQPRIRFLDSNGAPLVGGKIYTYLAGTTTPQATYTTAAGNVANTNPVILDSAGYADIWITGSYKIVVQDSNGALISTTDNIIGFSTGATGATFLDGSLTIQNTSDPTKQAVFNLAGIGTGTTVTIGVPNGNFTLISPAIAQTYTAAQREAFSTITYGSTITPDFSLANNYQVQLTGSPTINNPTNIVAGQSGNLSIYQDATGSRTITWGWGWVAPSGGSLPSLQTAGGSLDVLKYTVTAYNTSAVTITLATPGVISFTNHGFQLGQQVQLTTSGALPTGLTASTTYYVVPINANSFSLATSQANAAANTTIATSGSQSGVHTCVGLTIALTSSTAKQQLTLLATATASASSTLDFATQFTTTYSGYMLVFNSLLLSANATLTLYASGDNGSSWTVAFETQKQEIQLGVTTAPTNTTVAASSPAVIQSAPGGTPTTTNGNMFVTFASGGFLYFESSLSNVKQINASKTYGIANYANGGSIGVMGLRLAPASGNFTSGTIYLYGVKNT